MYRQCTLTQFIVNGFPSPDELPAALIMFISEKSFSYPMVSYIHIAMVVSIAIDFHKHVYTYWSHNSNGSDMAILFLYITHARKLLVFIMAVPF